METKVSTQNKFKEYYEDLYDSEKVCLRDRLYADYGITIPTFYRKLNLNNWSKLEKLAICDETKKDMNELF